MASTCSQVVAQIGSILVMRLCHYQSHIPENSIKSLLAGWDIHASKGPAQPAIRGAWHYHHDKHFFLFFHYAPTPGLRMLTFPAWPCCCREFGRAVSVLVSLGLLGSTGAPGQQRFSPSRWHGMSWHITADQDRTLGGLKGRCSITELRPNG